MTTSVIRVERTSGSTGRPTIAPAPSGGVYFAEGGDSSGVAHVSRIDSAGAVVWTKEITISGSTTANGVTPNVHSSSDHVAVVLRYFETAGAVYKTAVVLYQSDGTLVWQKTVPVTISRQAALNDAGGLGVGGLALAEDESVYMTGMMSSNTQLALIKLNGADGSLVWVVDLYPSTGAQTGDWPAEIELLSGGDPVVMFFGGEVAPFASEYTHIQRITASTGAAAWTRSINWNFGAGTGAALGVDPSDNIYLGWPVDASNNLGVVKLDSSGATLWNKRVSTGGSGSTRGAIRISATSTGVHLGFSMSTPTRGHFFVNSAGTGSTTPSITYSASGTLAYEVHGSRATGTQLLMVFSATITSVTRATIIRSDETTTADNGSYGAVHTRASSSVSLTTGTATIASPTYTRASAPSLTLSSASITESSGGLTSTLLAPNLSCTATGVASALAFGLPEMQGVQLPFTVSTAFGATTHRRGLYSTGAAAATVFGLPVANVSYAATGLLNTNAFGLPVYSPHHTLTATGIASTALVGDPDSIRGVGPYPIGYASSIDPATAFGAASITTVVNAAATGFSTTVFGTTTHAQGLSATALAPATAFGTPNGPVRANAQGFSPTVFGTAKISSLGYPTSLLSTVGFGTPALSNVYLCAATGWSSTVFGTPLTQWPTRTRSAKFRTQFGQAQAERTLP